MIEKTFLHQSNGNKIQKGSISVILNKVWGDDIIVGDRK